MASVGMRSNVDTSGGVNCDKVFVPHYESYAHRFPGASKPPPPPPTTCNRVEFCSRGGSSRSGLPPSSPQSGLQGLLQGPLHGHAPSLPPWPVSPSTPVVGSVGIVQHGPQYQQSWSGLYRKLSDIQVALRASEKAREDGEKETQALRVYVSNVETGAAGLVSRVQDLENLLALSTAFRQGHDAEQLRGKIATDALEEAHKQATAAAQSIAVARESTMELDKVKRETNAWAVAQEAEIERLNMEAAECRMLYEASNKLIQDLNAQIANLQRQLEHQNAKIEDSQKTLQIEAGAFQKKYEEVKVKELKSQDHGAAAVQYDQELRRVRSALGDEKAQLLDDLAQLRRSNQNLTEEMKVNWHAKLRSSTSKNMISPDHLQQHHTLSQQTPDLQLSANASKPGALCSKVDSGSTPEGGLCKGCRYPQEDVEEGSLSVESSASASGSWFTETSGTKDCNHRAADLNLWSHSSSDCSSKETLRQSNCSTAATRVKFPDSRSQYLSPGAASEGSGDESTEASALALKELTLLAAAQHEILKLKEINEQLVAACQ